MASGETSDTFLPVLAGGSAAPISCAVNAGGTSNVRAVAVRTVVASGLPPLQSRFFL